MKTLDRFTRGDKHGIHYAVSIFLATVVLWALSTAHRLYIVHFDYCVATPLLINSTQP